MMSVSKPSWILPATIGTAFAVASTACYFWHKSRQEVSPPSPVAETQSHQIPNHKTNMVKLPEEVMEPQIASSAESLLHGSPKQPQDFERNLAHLNDPSIISCKIGNLSLHSDSNSNHHSSWHPTNHDLEDKGIMRKLLDENTIHSAHTLQLSHPIHVATNSPYSEEDLQHMQRPAYVQTNKSFAQALVRNDDNVVPEYTNMLSPGDAVGYPHSSDGNSESSQDSGKGGSSVGSSSSQQHLHQQQATTMVYEFDLGQDMAGLFIGRNGRTISWLERKSGAVIMLRQHPKFKECQIVSVEGSEEAIDRALDAIAGRFHDIDLTQVNIPNIGGASQPEAVPASTPSTAPDVMQLGIPDGLDCEVTISSIVSAGHIFIHQPTHPSFMSLERLNYCMTGCYSQDEKIIPQLPRPIEVGVICAVPMDAAWYRAQVVNVNADTDECDIRYMDYGGYERKRACELRQIRSDFMTLPFQAVECYLAGVAPLDEEDEFSMEAVNILNDMTRGCVLTCKAIAQAEDGTPFVELYLYRSGVMVNINRELVSYGVCRWVEPQLVDTGTPSTVSSMSPEPQHHLVPC